MVSILVKETFYAIPASIAPASIPPSIASPAANKPALIQQQQNIFLILDINREKHPGFKKNQNENIF